MKRVYKRKGKSGLPLTMYAAAISALLAAVMVTSPVQNVIAEEIGVENEVEQRIDESESIVGRWKASEAGINGVKISADMVGLGDFFVTINEDENGEKTADLTYSKGGNEPVGIHGIRLIKETGGDDTILKFDVDIPSSDTPSLSEGQKNLAKMAETFGLKNFGEVKVNEDGKLEISAEFELFDAVICLERQSEEV